MHGHTLGDLELGHHHRNLEGYPFPPIASAQANHCSPVRSRDLNRRGRAATQVSCRPVFHSPLPTVSVLFKTVVCCPRSLQAKGSLEVRQEWRDGLCPSSLVTSGWDWGSWSPSSTPRIPVQYPNVTYGSLHSGFWGTNKVMKVPVWSRSRVTFRLLLRSRGWYRLGSPEALEYKQLWLQILNLEAQQQQAFSHYSCNCVRDLVFSPLSVEVLQSLPPQPQPPWQSPRNLYRGLERWLSG